jgi:anti-sigma regulatory factor (Ser/Thr protein kinase)
MGKQLRRPGERVREFILKNLGDHANDIVALTAKKFECSRQAVHKHLARLVDEGAVKQTGPRRTPSYQLSPLTSSHWEFPLDGSVTESDIWERDVLPILVALPKNVLGIWGHAFTEMVNNAIDHSRGTTLSVYLEYTAAHTSIVVRDDGIGIFRKIQGDLDLADERLALYELSKGKLTTDPSRHSGEGIFFSSRMLDQFSIFSGNLIFDHDRMREHDYLLERATPDNGTSVQMVLSNHTSRSTKKVFDEFSSKDGDYRFNKTVVPMSLAKYGPAELVSRSQAKRLLSRFDLFEIVVLDFKGVETIGQAFADEIFRVFARSHPNIEMPVVNASKQVGDMIARARSGLVAPPGARPAGKSGK